MEPIKDKPTCRLIGTDGNVFAIIGRVSRTLNQAGMPEEATKFQKEAFACGSYDHVLRLVIEYVDVG